MRSMYCTRNTENQVRKHKLFRRKGTAMYCRFCDNAREIVKRYKKVTHVTEPVHCSHSENRKTGARLKCVDGIMCEEHHDCGGKGCPACSTKEKHGHKGLRLCGRCHGVGETGGSQCPRCRGKGLWSYGRCPSCRGGVRLLTHKVGEPEVWEEKSPCPHCSLNEGLGNQLEDLVLISMQEEERAEEVPDLTS